MKNIRHLKLLILCVLVMHFSCKKPKITSPVENVSFTLNQKIAYTVAEEIIVTNNSVGTWEFEWYIDDQLVSENIILTKDKLQNKTFNLKHELKLVGVNSSGNIKICIDSFEYRDTLNFKSVKFYNYSNDFIKFLTEDSAARFIGLDLRYPNSASFINGTIHNPTTFNCLASYVWNSDSFKICENKYINPRSNDKWIVNPNSIKYNSLKTDIFIKQNNPYILYGSRKDNNRSLMPGSLKVPILEVAFDRKNNSILIKTSHLGITLKI